MGQAAVPAYLGRDFSQAAPGHRFNLYLPLWAAGSWAREADKAANRNGSPATGKTPTLQTVVRLAPYFKEMNRSLAQRQAALAEPLVAQGRLLTLHAEAVAPFTTGLGNEHPLENGFAFLNPYGLPYLAGSGVKGVLRQAARELAAGDWGDTQGWSAAAIDALFGKVGKPEAGSDEKADFQRGALMFWDVLPLVAGDALQVEVMTPHQSHYHQKGESPHESGMPNPINFLTVPPGSKFSFHIQCDLPFLRGLALRGQAPALADEDRWQTLLTAALAHAFQWLGFGAKTAVGYGAMKTDTARQAQAQAARIAAHREAERLQMSAGQRAIADFVDEMGRRVEQLRGGKEKLQAASHQRAQQFAKLALESADWTAPERAEAADAIEHWLPKVVQLSDRKDAFKKLKLSALRGLS